MYQIKYKIRLIVQYNIKQLKKDQNQHTNPVTADRIWRGCISANYYAV